MRIHALIRNTQIGKIMGDHLMDPALSRRTMANKKPRATSAGGKIWVRFEIVEVVIMKAPAIFVA